MADTPRTPRCPVSPAGLGKRGKRLWTAVHTVAEPDATELEVLTLACRALNRIDALEDVLKSADAVVEGSKGQPRPHPLASELRSETLLAAKLLGQLGMPDADPDLYGSWQGLSPSQRGRKAARRRWASRGG